MASCALTLTAPYLWHMITDPSTSHGVSTVNFLQGRQECHQAFPCCPHPTGTANPVVSIWILDKRTMAEGGASPAEIEAAAETARREASALARLKHPAIIKACHTAMFDTVGNLNFLPHSWLANRRRSCCLNSRLCWNRRLSCFYSLSRTCATGGVRRILLGSQPLLDLRSSCKPKEKPPRLSFRRWWRRWKRRGRSCCW